MPPHRPLLSGTYSVFLCFSDAVFVRCGMDKEDTNTSQSIGSATPSSPPASAAKCANETSFVPLILTFTVDSCSCTRRTQITSYRKHSLASVTIYGFLIVQGEGLIGNLGINGGIHRQVVINHRPSMRLSFYLGIRNEESGREEYGGVKKRATELDG